MSGTHFLGRDFWGGAISMTPAAQKLHSVPNITSPYSACPLELTILVCCRDNEDTIVQALETICEAMGVVNKTFEILVIDDASCDRSAEVVRDFMRQHETVPMLMRINKTAKGLAQNYTDGAFMGCGTYYRLLGGDNSEPVETMVDIFRSVGDADIIVPYYVSRLRQGRLEWLFLRLGNSLLNMISGNRINCYTAPHVHLRYNVMRWHSDVLGYGFQMDLLCQLLARDFTCKQVPCRAVSHSNDAHMTGVRKTLSVMHAVLNIVLRRMSLTVNNG